MYQRIRILENVDVGVVRVFQCFFNIKTQEYAVQSLDYFYLDDNMETQEISSNSRLMELFSEQSPIDRIGGHKTIEEAINSFINL